MTATVAFIGLGRMGLPMANRLIETGFSLRLYNRTASRADDLVARGVHLCSTPAQAAREAEYVVTMVADDQALLDVTLGDDGIASAFPAGGVHLSMSTVSPEANRAVAEAHQARGSELVAVPVMGRPEVAAAGALWLIAAGPTALEARLQPLLAAMGRGYTWVGEEPGLASVAKIAFNFFLFGMVETLAETLTLVEKHGGDRGRFFEALSSAFGSPMVAGYGKRMLTEAFVPAGFTSILALKDIRLALQLAESGRSPLPVASLVRDHLLTGLARGRGEWDLASVVQGARESAGLA